MVHDANFWAAVAGLASAASATLNLIVVCVSTQYMKRGTLATEAYTRMAMRPTIILSASLPEGVAEGLFTLHLRNVGPGSCHDPRVWRKGEFFHFSGHFEAMPSIDASGHDVTMPNDHLIPASSSSDCDLISGEGAGASGYVLEFADAGGNREQIHFFATHLPGFVRLTILGTAFLSVRESESRTRKRRSLVGEG